MPRNDLEELFSNPASALFAHVAKSGRPREKQRDYAIAFGELLERRHGVGLFQGETGIGKTLAYLVPAALKAANSGKRVVISTFTLALQKQIFEEMPGVLDLVQDLTGKRLTAARRVGRRNFISVPMLKKRAEQIEAEGYRPMAALLREIAADLATAPQEATRQRIQELFGERFLGLEAPPRLLDNLEIGQVPDDTAGYDEMVAISRHADILIVNHALLATHLISFGRVLFDAGNDREVILVVDEADELPGAVKNMIQRKVPINDLRSLAKKLSEDANPPVEEGEKAKRPKKPKRPLSEIEKTIETVAASVKALEEHPEILRGSENTGILVLSPRLRPIADALLRQLKVTATVLERQIGTQERVPDSDLRAVLADIDAVTMNLESVRQGQEMDSTTSVYWSPIRNFAGFHVDGGDPRVAISRLWRLEKYRPATLLMTSATLTTRRDRSDVDPSMTDFAADIGMKGDTHLAWATKRCFSPEMYGSMEFVVIDQVTAPPVVIEVDGENDEIVRETNGAIITWWAEMVRKAGEYNGRVLVLTNSYADAEKLAKKLEVPGRTILLEERGKADLTLGQFRNDPSAILVTPARWTGLDMPGLIKHVVVTRLPLAPPDVVHDAVRETYLRTARHMRLDQIKWDRFAATMASGRRKFLQGIGRGIRREEDSVTVWIGDSRWPMSKDRQEIHPGVLVRTWALSFAGAIPDRFKARLRVARCFSPERGLFESDDTAGASRDGAGATKSRSKHRTTPQSRLAS